MYNVVNTMCLHEVDKLLYLTDIISDRLLRRKNINSDPPMCQNLLLSPLLYRVIVLHWVVNFVLNYRRTDAPKATT